MIQDITPPDPGQFIQVKRPKHTHGPDCPACRRIDTTARNKRRREAKIAAAKERIDGLVGHCKHPQTRTIRFDHVVEGEHGEVLEQDDAQQCIGCGRILWERL